MYVVYILACIFLSQLITNALQPFTLFYIPMKTFMEQKKNGKQTRNKKFRNIKLFTRNNMDANHRNYRPKIDEIKKN